MLREKTSLGPATFPTRQFRYLSFRNTLVANKLHNGPDESMTRVRGVCDSSQGRYSGEGVCNIKSEELHLAGAQSAPNYSEGSRSTRTPGRCMIYCIADREILELGILKPEIWDLDIRRTLVPY